MGFLWKTNLPRKGWIHAEVEDLGRESRTNCEWCNTEIRYAHHLKHEEASETVSGCECAEKLTSDYVNPKLREKRLKSKRVLLKRFMNPSRWIINVKGNHIFKGRNPQVLVFRKEGSWKAKVGENWGKIPFTDSSAAKLAVFEYCFKKGLI